LSQGPGKAVGCGAGSPVGIAHRVGGSAGRLGTQQQGEDRESREGAQAGEAASAGTEEDGMQGRIRRQRPVTACSMGCLGAKRQCLTRGDKKDPLASIWRDDG
jgi:hypothetical protein